MDCFPDNWLALKGTRVSAITIQKLLNDHGLGTRIERWLALEEANVGKVIDITAEQAAFLEKLNPCFRERHVESSAPGELLPAGTFFVGSLKGMGKVHLHAVVNTYSSCAFGLPRTSPGSPRPRWRCCTKTCCPSVPNSACR